MCGIVGGISNRDIVPIMIEGLKRVEYRGYDSAGIAYIKNNAIQSVKAKGKIKELEKKLDTNSFGFAGIGHTRWATHGKVSVKNCHPHVTHKRIAIVHNGIIENYEQLKAKLSKKGINFLSDTDSEAISALIYSKLSSKTALKDAVKLACQELVGSFAFVAMDSDEPNSLVAVRRGCPLIIGSGIGENFVASDIAAILAVTNKFQYLEDDQIAILSKDSFVIVNKNGKKVPNKIIASTASLESFEKMGYRHFMEKEIHEQPIVMESILEGRVTNNKILNVLSQQSLQAICSSDFIDIVACGTSYHAGLTAKYYFESLADVEVRVHIASEFRYTPPQIRGNGTFICISQSGETLDTIEALRLAKKMGYTSILGVCNVPHSTLTREADDTVYTRAGAEIGVASTKAFTAQLLSLVLVVLAIAKEKNNLKNKESQYVKELHQLPMLAEKALKLEKSIELISKRFADKRHALFLGRGICVPIAYEGALKLKEISYIHAEAYPAGELKHGPIALIDKDMPVVILSLDDDMADKVFNNLKEVEARGAEIFVFSEIGKHLEKLNKVHNISLGERLTILQAPLIMNIPLQLLSYHCALLKGTDI
ncbi:MAG: glutamine--fructose-6-phosphate transaminase (isomerizing), partial [Gammaproteobacteria bacterium]